MAKVLARNPNVAGAAGYVNAPAKGVAGHLVNCPGNKQNIVKSVGAQSVTISCEGYKDYVLSIKKDSIVLVPSSTVDVYKVWEKDDSWGDGFAIVNSDTNQAIQRPAGPGQRLRLVPYDTTQRDDSVMWTKEDVGTASCYIREHDDATLVFDTLVRGVDILVIVSKNLGKTNQKWNIKNN